MDKFEKHIRDHKDQFDDHKANRDKMWAAIEGRLDSKDRIQESRSITKTIKPWYLRRSIQIAATMALLIGLGLGLMINNTTDSNQIAEPTELLEIDFYYEKIIAKQVRMIEESNELSQSDKDEFLDFFQEMDEEYLTLKNELKSGIDFENILEAIILHYQKRLDITEGMLDRINSTKNEKEQKGILL